MECGLGIGKSEIEMNWYKEFIVEHHLFGAPGRVNDPELLYPPFREKIRRLIAHPVYRQNTDIFLHMLTSWKERLIQICFEKQH